MFLAVGLGFGSGRSSGSSAGLGDGFTRRGRLDCALAKLANSKTRTPSDSAGWKRRLIIRASSRERFFLRLTQLRQKHLFSDAEGALLVRPDATVSNVSQLAQLRQTSIYSPPKESGRQSSLSPAALLRWETRSRPNLKRQLTSQTENSLGQFFKFTPEFSIWARRLDRWEQRRRGGAPHFPERRHLEGVLCDSFDGPPTRSSSRSEGADLAERRLDFFRRVQQTRSQSCAGDSVGSRRGDNAPC